MNKDSKRSIDKAIDLQIVLAIVVTLIFWASAFAGIKVGFESL